MFEKEAEEIANKRCHEIGCFGHCNFSSPKHHRCGEWHREYNCALDGYHEGFKDCAKSRLNVTTISDCPIKDEWHYVKDGDLPDNQRKVEVFTKDRDIFIAVIDSEGEEWYTGRYFGKAISMNQVIAWKEIVLPKESE